MTYLPKVKVSIFKDDKEFRSPVWKESISRSHVVIVGDRVVKNAFAMREEK